LTTDIWDIDFVECAECCITNSTTTLHQEDCVVLLSGGLDSLAGTIDLVATGKRPYAVSQVAKGDKEKQAQFAAAIGGGINHIQFSTNVKLPEQEQPPAQRARSFLFLAYGVLVATALQRYHNGSDVNLYVCENGFISINPPLTGQRLGSLSTRTTHPYFIQQFQQLLKAADLRVQIITPYQYLTKGEILTSCQNQALLSQYAHQSTSCGRYTRYGYMHCGRCVPCLIRRASFYAWGVKDCTKYKYHNLSIAATNPNSFDDVWSAAFAVTQVQQDGLDSWLGATLNSTLIGDTTKYKSTVERGLHEVAQFLRYAGVL
jgi:7-cyano-7-deazaguanine synthase in queuosine biosynthesis